MADKLVAAALQEIAAEGAQGCSISKLWTLLQSTPAALEAHLDDHVKQVVWQAVLQVPGLSFNSPSSSPIQSSDPTLQALQTAETLGATVVASQELRDACLGLYDIRHADTQPSQIQHSILERLAKARTEGVTQNQLGKDFKVEGNKLFYILRSLESRGLVVRRATLVRNKDSIKGGGSIVLTNLVHLTRYAKHLTLNSHQRFEISNNEDAGAVGGFHEDVEEGEDGQMKGKHLMINDDLPAMKAICEKLQQAEGKVLVVSDLKLTLGYRMSSGHRAWRRLMKRLKEAGFVTIIEAKVGRKVRSCIQLLKPFNEHEFSSGTAEAETEQQLKGPKRGQVTEQLVELSVDQQIFDMIDNGGGEGLMMMEVWKRIGLNNKRNYYRIQNMTIKHGILFEAENHKRSTLYRLRTSSSKREPPPPEPELLPGLEPDTSFEPISNESHKRAQKLPPVRKTSRRKLEASELTESMVKIDVETDAGNAVITTLNPVDEPGCSSGIIEAPEIDPALASPSSSSILSNFPPPSLFRIGQPYPCLTVTTTSIQRESRIMERLQEEKFVVRAELHRWLESISNRKTMMDRKTLTRTLQKLQREGRCKCILLSMPGSTNCGRKRTAEVVLLPSVKVEPDLLSVIHERIRKFDMESRGHGQPRERASSSSAPVIAGLKRMKVKQNKAPVNQNPVDVGKTVALQVNGFIPSKMVRVRMLHYFLWGYTNEFVDEEVGVVEVARLGDGSGYRVFALMAAVQAMPLELFLQVVGSNRMIENLSERCRERSRIRELPEAEQVVLLENGAGGRLAWLIDILRRLKLIRIVIGHGPVVLQDRWQIGSLSISMIEASLTYAMEEQMFIEQPAPQPLPSLTKQTFDFNPRARHEFDINSKESLDNYWQTLEYFFSGAEPAIARHAFPGSSVPELFGLRSWTSLRIMTMDQRNELIRRMNEGGPEKRKSIQDCAKIAKDLNLTLEQVLRVSYEKNRRVRLQSLQKSEPNFMEAFVSSQTLPSFDGAPVEDPALGATILSPGISDVIHTDKEVDDGDDGEDQFNHISIVAKLKPSRSRRFPWSDKLDRALFYAYAKQRALLGAKMNRVDWNSIPGLPADPVVSRRRLSILKSETTVKKAILNLCSLLSARYEKYCQLMENLEEQQQQQQQQQAPSTSDPELQLPAQNEEMMNNLQEQPEFHWDNSEDPAVVSAIDEILRCKFLVRSSYNKPSHNKRTVGASSGDPGENSNSNPISLAAAAAAASGGISVDPLHLSSAAGLMQVSRKAPPRPGGRSHGATIRSRRIRKKTKKKPASLQTLSTDDLVHASIGVANAIEFIKLVFLNTSVSSDDVQLPKAFMDALHQFKESDVFTAFNFLKERSMVASGEGAQSFILSESFYQNSSASRFPGTTGEEALAMAGWVKEHLEEINESWLPYSFEENCGNLLELLEEVSAGELQMAPRLPASGIGESEEPRSIGCSLKRKLENQVQGARTAKARLEEKDEVYQAVRRERGFPGIEVLVHRQAFSVAELLSSSELENEASSSHEEIQLDIIEKHEDHELLDRELLDMAIVEVQKAGEEGLSFKELARALGMGDSLVDLALVERVAESLDSAGHAKKVNAFDHVRVLDQAHAGRYFLEFSAKKSDKTQEASTSSAMEIDGEAIEPELKALTTTLPILPWLTSSGILNMKILKGLIRRVIGIVTLHPGIIEENLLKRMNILNPQTARELLSMLLLEGKLTARTVTHHQVSPPTLLGALLEKTKPRVSQVKHYYTSPLCSPDL